MIAVYFRCLYIKSDTPSYDKDNETVEFHRGLDQYIYGYTILFPMYYRMCEMHDFMKWRMYW